MAIIYIFGVFVLAVRHPYFTSSPCSNLYDMVNPTLISSATRSEPSDNVAVILINTPLSFLRHPNNYKYNPIIFSWNLNFLDFTSSPCDSLKFSPQYFYFKVL